MLLAIDIGNSNIAAGVFHDEKLVSTLRIRTDPERTADEYEALISSILSTRSISPTKVSGAVLSTVVPGLLETFRRVVERLIGGSPLVVSGALDLGLSFAVDRPLEVGTDLLANAVAAHELAGSSCIIIDFGTAISITNVAAGGVFRGVSIAPGLETAMEALTSQTAQLPHVRIEAPPKAIGTNTVHAIQSGVVLGYAGLVEGLVSRISAELPAPVTTIATGGLSGAVRGVLRGIDRYEPWLTLEGLRLIHLRTAATA
jgi:type III pantothenate kinase